MGRWKAMILPVPHISAIPAHPLVPVPEGEISLAATTSSSPPAPVVARAVAAVLARPAQAPDPENTRLTTALAAEHALMPDRILCATGSYDLLQAVLYAFADEENAVLATENCPPHFKTACQLTRAPFRLAEESGYTVSVDVLLEQVRMDTRIVLISNPGNPTGTLLPLGEITRLRDKLRDDILLVVDESFVDFAGVADASALPLVSRENTVILRSLTEVCGLQALPAGWAYAPTAIVAEMRKALPPYPLSVTAEAAATAALMDRAYLQQTRWRIRERRTRIATQLRDMGFAVPDSATNFLLVPFASMKEALRADEILRAEGLVTLTQPTARLPHCLRIRVADDAVMARVVACLEGV